MHAASPREAELRPIRPKKLGCAAGLVCHAASAEGDRRRFGSPESPVRADRRLLAAWIGTRPSSQAQAAWKTASWIYQPYRSIRDINRGDTLLNRCRTTAAAKRSKHRAAKRIDIACLLTHQLGNWTRSAARSRRARHNKPWPPSPKRPPPSSAAGAGRATRPRRNSIYITP